MQICVDENNKVVSYSDIDNVFEDGITIELPENIEHFKKYYMTYSYINQVLSFSKDEEDEEERKQFAVLQQLKQNENNYLLSEYLKTHPLLWSDGKYYGVSQEDQQEIVLNLTQYQLTTSLQLPSRLEWHAVHEECRDFTAEELTALILQITAFVYPLVRKNQTYKVGIYSATTTLEDLEKIQLSYESEQ